ncbi:MAG: N-acetylglucosamine-6-phosphate deacetylase [Eubacteriales bacterium]|nr:N-acetylglucosamine-6-phosphate deacetylase [Eubacteriales bacterium]
MKAIVNGKIILPDSIVEGRALLFDEKIAGLSETVPEGAEIIDAKGRYVAPGLVDIHIHGYLGEDTSDGSVEGIRKMAEGIVKNGVTAWLPTTMTVSYDDLRHAFDAVRVLMDKKNNPKGAQIMGVHAEGPFINPSKKGAQAVEYIRPADAPFLIENSDVIRIVTIAPEMPGALDCIREVTEKTSILVSMGHTAANYETAKAGIEAGVRHATHLFNAMTPLNHRDPGVVGASLADDRVSTELIADTFHISPDLFGLVAKVKGDNLILITDCTRAGGLEDGEYTLGGQPIFVKGIECRLADGTIAGSVLKLNNAIRNMRDHTSLPLEQIVRMASINAARCIGLDKTKGSLEAGKDADIILADENFAVSETIIAGETVWAAE